MHARRKGRVLSRVVRLVLFAVSGSGVWIGACMIPERTYDASLDPGVVGAAEGDRNIVERPDAGGNVDAEPPSVAPAPSLCDRYCTELFTQEKCGDPAVRVYETVTQCLDVCALLPEGDASATSGNSVHCRFNQLNQPGFEANDCDNVGPITRPGVCGEPCEVFCSLQSAACGDRAEPEYCQSVCGLLKQAPTYRASAFIEADTLQCRLGHLARSLAPSASPDECLFAQVMVGTGAPCRDSLESVTVESDRAMYCALIEESCQGELAAYESREQCESVSEVFVRGTESDFEVNTLRCRLYHAYLSLGPAKEMHCRHAGPSGDGKCALPEEATLGTCQSYCAILLDACSDELGELDEAECLTECLALPDSGPGQFAADPAYSVNTPLDTGSLKCRTLHAVRARGGNLDACVDAFSADAECPGNPLQ